MFLFDGCPQNLKPHIYQYTMKKMEITYINSQMRLSVPQSGSGKESEPTIRDRTGRARELAYYSKLTDEETETGSHTSWQNGISHHSRLDQLAIARDAAAPRGDKHTPSTARKLAGLRGPLRSLAYARPLAGPPARAALPRGGRKEPAGARGAQVRSRGTGTLPFTSETQGPGFTTLWKMVEGSGRAARVAWPSRAPVPAQHAPLSPPQWPERFRSHC